MKKKKLIIVLVIGVLLLLLVPIPIKLRDGGSIEYKAILYNVTKIHRFNELSSTGYEDGFRIKILGIQVYYKVNTHIDVKEDEEYELIVDDNFCFNCLMLVYEFSDGRKIYDACTKITYKNNNIEIPLSEAIEKGLITLSDLKHHGYYITEPEEKVNYNCG